MLSIIWQDDCVSGLCTAHTPADILSQTLQHCTQHSTSLLPWTRTCEVGLELTDPLFILQHCHTHFAEFSTYVDSTDVK